MNGNGRKTVWSRDFWRLCVPFRNILTMAGAIRTHSPVLAIRRLGSYTSSDRQGPRADRAGNLLHVSRQTTDQPAGDRFRNVVFLQRRLFAAVLINS
jgi:hypothetical protein